MARPFTHVTFQPTDTARVPDDLTEGAALLLDLQNRGAVEELGQRLLIRRQGGYGGLDIFLMVLLFFTTGARRGLRGFWDRLRPHVLKLAALAGRRSLPSPASVSRALEGVEFELIRPVAPLLLWEMPGIDPVMLHPSAQTYNALGQGVHVFDLDPTVTTLRQRALPASEDLPEPRRRSEQTGAPGHRGRKRGELVFRRVTVQHAGSAAWVHAHLSPGNGAGVPDVLPALDAVVQTCERLGQPRSLALVRMDGEFGSIPFFAACRARSLPFVTRLNRPKLFEDPVVLERIRKGPWFRVPDSGSGPQRAAMDLGVLLIPPGVKTRTPDGSPYHPVQLRVVASAFPTTEPANHGRVLDGWQVELFAVDLPANAWPAPEAVALYFGRAAEENRFAQEDRELGLDRILSYHLPGQELCTLVGLALWNLRLVRGFLQERPPEQRPASTPRVAVVDDRLPLGWPRDPVLQGTLCDMNWELLLDRLPGWYWDDVAQELRCEAKRPMSLTTVRPTENASGQTGVIFCRPKGGCADCEVRARCLQSACEEASKHVWFSVATKEAETLHDRLALVRGKPAIGAVIGAIRERPGTREVIAPLFLPAVARQVFCGNFIGASLRIEVELPPAPAPWPRLVARNAAQRQRRRKTWAENLARYALPESARVLVQASGSMAFRQMLGEMTNPEATTSAAGAV
jgi:hypothetical protein